MVLQALVNLPCYVHLNKMFELYTEQYAEGKILLDGTNILTDEQDIALLRAE